jgi:hypothetical protein
LSMAKGDWRDRGLGKWRSLHPRPIIIRRNRLNTNA